MYFVLAVGILNAMRWMVCAENLGSCVSAPDGLRWHVVGEGRILSMRSNDDSGLTRRWRLAAMGAAAIAAFCLGAGHCARAADRNSPAASSRPGGSLPASGMASAPGIHLQVKSYLLDLAGDHSLNGATVTEQSTAGYANYTVQLRLASGGEQSVVVAAPPGGLQIDMQDMTGDHVPNDVILRPARLRWPPTVLVNDGHDHFAVVVSGADRSSVSSRKNFGSRPRDSQTFACLRSSGFKSIPIPASTRLLLPQLHEHPASPLDPSFALGAEHPSTSGRAPPFRAIA